MTQEMQFKTMAAQYCEVAAEEMTDDMRFREDLGFSSLDFMSFLGELEDTFDVRGQVKTLELSGVGTLEGQAANDVMAVLLDNATLKSADATARKQSLTVTLESGVKLQLGVSGDTVCGCGGWSCPEFFEAFEAAL